MDQKGITSVPDGTSTKSSTRQAPCDQQTHYESSAPASNSPNWKRPSVYHTLHCIHILTRTRPITVSTLVVPSQLHLIYVVDLSLMIKQIAIISGPCLALSWVHTHKHVCEEALKPTHIIPTYEHLTFRLMICEEKRL